MHDWPWIHRNDSFRGWWAVTVASVIGRVHLRLSCRWVEPAVMENWAETDLGELCNGRCWPLQPVMLAFLSRGTETLSGKSPLIVYDTSFNPMRWWIAGGLLAAKVAGSLASILAIEWGIAWLVQSNFSIDPIEEWHR